MHVLVGEDLGRLMLRRVWPWHRMLACSRAGRLDRELAAGTSPEASAVLAARAARLTSTEFRRDLAASLRRMLAASVPRPSRLFPRRVPGSPRRGRRGSRSARRGSARPAPGWPSWPAACSSPGRCRCAAWPW